MLQDTKGRGNVTERLGTTSADSPSGCTDTYSPGAMASTF